MNNRLDPKCLELARHFIPQANPETQTEMAQAIQDSVEDFRMLMEAAGVPANESQS